MSTYARRPNGHAPSAPRRTSHYAHAADGRASAGAQANAQLVAQVARQMGVDPVTAVATMLTESRGNSHAVGDHGSSFGLFQLHRGGELGRMSAQEAYDPRRNAEVALSQFARVGGRGLSPGALAAAAQRPGNRAAYARKVNANLALARRLLSGTSYA